jgi:hypothetical protein
MAYVYQHRRLDTNEIFYVGIAKSEKRFYSHRNRNAHWKRIAKKCGYEVDVLIRGCTWEDACERIKEVYSLSREERKARGLKGREWALSDEAGFTAERQGERVMEAFTELFNTWKPREKYEIVNATEYKGKFLNHKIVY